MRSVQKWPNVPAVYGWLALDRRGNWSIKTTGGRFEPIAHTAMLAFIGRNYEHDERGRWFVQNGPQRVYVALDYTPWVYRLDDTGGAIQTHTGAKPRELRRLFLDDAGALLLETELGIGVLLDRDLQTLLAHLSGPDGERPELLLEGELRRPVSCRLFGRALPLAAIPAAEVAERFAFLARPAAPAGQPDC